MAPHVLRAVAMTKTRIMGALLLAAGLGLGGCTGDDDDGGGADAAGATPDAGGGAIDGAADLDAGAPDGAAAMTVTLLATEDTIVQSGAPTEAVDDSPVLVTLDGGGEIHSYVKFDLSTIPAGAAVISAKLELYYCRCDGIRAIEALPAGGPWSGATLTWDNRPLPITPAEPLDVVNLNPSFATDFDCGDTDAYVAQAGGAADKAGWFVTSLVAAWVGGAPNHGFFFRAADAMTPSPAMMGIFGSLEGASGGVPCPANPPRLVVEYLP